ncbi:hypothetical protein [Nonomuraea sp. NPDC002799]
MPKTASVPAAAARTDPGFFKRLIGELHPLRQTTRSAMTMSGLGVAALAIDVAATLNIGNPWLFYDRRETWKELSGSLEGNKLDMWRDYFDHVSPNWKGQASTTVKEYMRFNQDFLFAKLGDVGDQMSTTMQNQYEEVLEYDISVFGVYASSASILRALARMSGHPIGRAALVAQATVFTGMLSTMVKQFADIYNNNEGDLNKLEQSLNKLKAQFYHGGNPEQGARELTLSPTVDDPSRLDREWIPAPEAEPQ